MRKTGLLALLVVLSLAAVAAMAQDGTVGQLYFIEVESENNATWLEAYGKHIEFHRQSNDDWSWPIWVISSGPRTGRYVVGTFGHEWEDFDREFGAKDSADAWKNQAPLSESIKVEFWNQLPERSREPENAQHSILTVNYTRIKAGMASQYWRGIDKINSALDQANWPSKAWVSSVVNSGQGRWVVRVSPRSGFSALAPPSQSFAEAMTKAHGADEFEAIMDSLRDSVEDGYSEIWTLMPDLSYIPEN